MITLAKIVTILLLLCCLALVALAFVPHASADGGGPITQTVTTTVRSVHFYYPKSAVSYCYLRLANGRTLTAVYGAECRAKPGQTVTLRYTSACRPLIGCRPQLAEWDLR